MGRQDHLSVTDADRLGDRWGEVPKAMLVAEDGVASTQTPATGHG